MMQKRLLLIFFFLFASSLPAQNKGMYRVVLEPRLQTMISSEVTSTVRELDKKMGERFSKGEQIMLLDDRIFVLNQKKAIALRENARVNLETVQELYNDKSASRTQLAEAKAALAVTEADLALAEKALQACRVIAPYEGKVQEVFVEEYERVEPGQQLVELIDDTVLIAKLLIDAEYISRLHVGQKVNVSVPNVNREFEAEVTHIAAAINPASSLIKVDARIDNKDSKLKAGMIGVLRLVPQQPAPIKEKRKSGL